MRVLIIDNLDSFTNNIAQYLYEVCGEHPVVVPNTHSLAQLKLDRYDAVVLSPGPGHPGRPGDFGVCREVLEHAGLPVLGVCLGHQGINCFFGGQVEHAPAPVHGYRTRIRHAGTGLFEGIEQDFAAVRYHSLVCTEVPESLEVTARSECGLVMALAHRQRPVWGVQFHPESIDSQHGKRLFGNFLRMVKQCQKGAIEKQVAHALRLAGGPSTLAPDYRLMDPAADPLATFEHQFGDCTAAFWLDSERAERSRARYSLMGACDPDAALVFSYNVEQRLLTIEGPAGKTSLAGDFFELMAGVTASLRPACWPQAPFPFRGGLVGYLGYELKALNGAENLHVSPLPDSLLYLPKNMIVFDHQLGVGYLCHLWGERLALKPVPPVSRAADAAFSPGPVAEAALNLADGSSAYQEKVRACLAQITEGESYEICLTNRARMVCPDTPLAVYKRMRAISPVPYGAYIDTGAFAILSASPETFLKIDATGGIRSRPIKGTRPRGSSPVADQALREELAASAKDRAENLMIVDLVRHDLNGICVAGSVEVPDAFSIESYSSVHQLVSTVQGQLRAGVDAFTAIKACFPGGSMTGAPKVRTMAIIDRLEASARGVYSGALGWIGMDGYTELSVVIRTAVVRDGMATFGIGGAIVAASDPADEMEETLVKASVPFHSIKG
ncbi:aminodeoxychorismate synthase component I [Pseudomonas sp. Marseille-P9899]|uniref:aminodeoxychorismate synthase component I n=1 Tax=Pseudomonas sp. Marseille-P9899 TaxID=2730401 RepID=UPI00158A0348|nr:aminodeoxychorismate synthase component I [Pseudomonas sp. Marseille-P9899]